MTVAEKKLDADFIRQALYKNWVNFVYLKLNGELRDAIGTTKPEFIPEDKQPTGTTSAWPETDDDVIRYFDKDKNAWRSFVTDNLVVFQPVGINAN